MAAVSINNLSDVTVERIVLAGIYAFGQKSYLDIADLIGASSFTDKTNQALYKCFKHLFEKKELETLDESSIYSAAHEMDCDWIFEKTAECRHVRGILNTSVNEENVRKWTVKLKKLEIARLLHKTLQEATEEVSNISGDEPIGTILGIAEKKILDFTTNVSKEENEEPLLLSEGLDDYLDQIENNPIDVVGISSGYPLYDYAIGGGFRRKTVNLIGARTGVGKSMLAGNIGLHVSEELNIPILYLDTEMSNEDHWHRIMANKAGVTIHDVETGKYIKSQLIANKVRKAAKDIKTLPFHYLNVSGKSSEEILSIMRRWLAKEVGSDESGRTNPCLIIYDYLKMMSSDGISSSMKEYQILGFMMTEMHNFAVRQDVPILSFIQLNRDGIDREATDIVSGSDRVVWLTSNLCIFKPKSDAEIADDGAENGNVKLVPLKCRHGAGLPPGDYINMLIQGEYARIIEKETKYNLLQGKNSKQEPDLIEDNQDVNFGNSDEDKTDQANLF